MYAQYDTVHACLQDSPSKLLHSNRAESVSLLIPHCEVYVDALQLPVRHFHSFLKDVKKTFSYMCANQACHVCFSLQSQFGYGLREAAHNLKICPTTLKRACRRHGIYRWPRRQGWAGASGDAGCTESMNLDGDSVSSAGLNTASEQQAPAGPAPATGQLYNFFGPLTHADQQLTSELCLASSP